jgi:hypothetical protein
MKDEQMTKVRLRHVQISLLRWQAKVFFLALKCSFIYLNYKFIDSYKYRVYALIVLLIYTHPSCPKRR